MWGTFVLFSSQNGPRGVLRESEVGGRFVDFIVKNLNTAKHKTINESCKLSSNDMHVEAKRGRPQLRSVSRV